MRNKFDMQLERLNGQLTHMGEMCEIAITRATKAWKMVRWMRRNLSRRQMKRLTS